MRPAPTRRKKARPGPDGRSPVDAGRKLTSRGCGQFETELALWNADETTHLVAIATFGSDNAGVAAVEEMALGLTTENWIPVEQLHDMHLLAALIDSGRRFSKGLRYNLASSRPLASVGLDGGRGDDALASCSCGTLPFAIEVVRRVTQT